MPYTSNVHLPSGINDSHTSAAERRVDETLARLPELDEPIVLSIEGNIGAGKTTFLDVLTQYFGEDNIELVHEPVEQWKDIEGNNMLEAFYKDPKRYAYTFQSFALITRLIDQQRPQKKLIRILERSCFSDHCFADNCHGNGNMNELEYSAYKVWWQFLVKHLPGRPNGVVYLRTTPEVCYARMCERNRQEEAGVPPDYLVDLHKRHEDWLPEGNVVDTVHDVPFITLDATANFKSDLKVQRELIDSVIDLIHRLAAKNA